jgi:hypothetical protein
MRESAGILASQLILVKSGYRELSETLYSHVHGGCGMNSAGDRSCVAQLPRIDRGDFEKGQERWILLR